MLSITYNSGMVDALKGSIEKRLTRYEDQDKFKFATTLDPRFKLKWCPNEDEREDIKIKLLQCMAKEREECVLTDSSNNEWQCTILLADNGHFPFIYGKWPGKIASIRPFLSVHCKSNVDFLFGCQLGEMKRSRPQIDSETKSRSVTYMTFLKWRRDYDREYSTLSWLDCEKNGTR